MIILMFIITQNYHHRIFLLQESSDSDNTDQNQDIEVCKRMSSLQ